MGEWVSRLVLSVAFAATLDVGAMIGSAGADQPRMYSARDNLQAARGDLMAATADINADISFDRRY